MILLELFISFCKIGFTSFGGLSMIPLISSEMISHGWMTAGEVSDIVAIAEMTPGPLGLNCATFCGIRVAGVLGSVVTYLGVLSPTLTVGLIVAIFFEKFKESTAMKSIMVGIRPACIGLICAVMVTLSMTNYFTDTGINLAAVFIGCVMMLCSLKLKWSVPRMIIVSAVLGLILA